MTDEQTPKVMRLADFAGHPDQVQEPIRILSLEELREQAGAVRWLVKGVIPDESLGVLFGASSAFKTFVSLDFALHVAHGLNWLGRKTRKGAVLLIAAEGGTGLWRRIVAWHREHRLHWKDAAVYVMPTAVDLGADATLVRDATAAIDVKPALVVIDTLAATFSGEENSAQEVGGYLREIGLQFRSSWQCAVLVVHHTGRAAAERPRGSSALRSNVDFMFGVYRDEKEMLATMECHKMKDGDLPQAVSFSMKVCELAKDEDGDPITSLVARALDSSGQVLDIMGYEAGRGRGGHNSRLLELATNGVDEKKLRTVFYETVNGDAEAKRQAYYRSRRWAVSAGFIEIAQGVVIRLDGGVTRGADKA